MYREVPPFEGLVIKHCFNRILKDATASRAKGVGAGSGDLS